MDSGLISFIVGYVIIINMIGFIILYLKVRTDCIKLSEKKLNIILLVLSLIGGFIGVLTGAEMLQYERDNKLFKRWIPLIIFLEIVGIVLIIYSNSAK